MTQLVMYMRKRKPHGDSFRQGFENQPEAVDGFMFVAGVFIHEKLCSSFSFYTLTIVQYFHNSTVHITLGCVMRYLIAPLVYELFIN